MRKLRKSLLASLGLLPFLMPMDVGAAERDASADELLRSGEEVSWKKARLSLEAQTGSRTIGTLDAFIPFMGNDDFLIYADIITKFGTGAKNKNGSTWEGNVGLGVRRVNDSETAIYGVYAFFDYLKSVNDNYFSQVTVGAERLGMTWDFRVNAYLPIGTKEYSKDNYTGVVIDQHNLIEYYKSETETVSRGADIEIGRTLGSQNLRGYVAAYSFGKDLTGSRLRLEYKINDHFALNAAVQHDKDRGTQYLMGARFTLGGAKTKSNNSIYGRLADQVVRDVDIVTKQTVIDQSRIELDKFWVVDADQEGSGDGTLENPYKYLDDAIEKAPEGAIIFVKGQDGSVNQIRDRINLKNGQTLWGGDQALYWDFNSNTPGFADGDNIVLIHDGEGVRQSISGGIEMADNSSIYNFNIMADGDNFDHSGIYINNKHGVVVDNVNISNFHSGDSDNPYSGIYVTGDDASAMFKHVILDNNDTGITVDGGQVTFDNINITNSRFYGMKLANATVNAGNISIDQSGINGVYAENSNLQASSLTINNTSQGSGYYQHGGNAIFDGNVSIDNSAESGLSLHGVNFSANSVNIDHSVAGYGIVQQGGTFTTQGDITVANSGIDGLHFVDTVVSGQAVNVTASRSHGYYQQGGQANFANTVSISSSGQSGLSLFDVFFTADNASLIGNGMNGDVEDGSGMSADNAEINIRDITANTNGQNGVSLKNSHIISDAITSNENVNNGLVIDGNKESQQSIIGTVTSNDNVGGNGVKISNSNVVTASVTTEGNQYGIYLNDGQLQIADGGSISNNKLDGIALYGSTSWLNANNISIADNVGHGLQLNDGSTAMIENVTVTGNGMSTLDNAHNIDELTSGIQIVNGTLTATHITVENNAGGIELMKGIIAINDGDTTLGQTSTISNNTGYGVYAHSADSNNLGNRNIRIGNTQINGNLSVDGFTNSGNGIYAQDVDSIKLHQITINDNAAGGINAHSATRDLDLTITGGEIRANKAGAGIDVSGINSDINLTDVQIAHNVGAGVVSTAQDTSTFTANGASITDNVGDGIKLDAQKNITINVEGSHVDNNEGNGVAATSVLSNVDVSIKDGSVSNNELDGLHLETEKEVTTLGGNSITNHIILANSQISGNGVNGIYLQQHYKATALYEFTKSIIDKNSNGGLYITQGTLTGILTDAGIQKNNHLGITKTGDFANL